MISLGLAYAVLSGVCNGLFTAPMKVVRGWKWENIWLVFILVSCLVMPGAIVAATIPLGAVLAASPAGAIRAAAGFGFAWGFGAILFGLGVDRLGVSLANSLVIGISSALGSVLPLALQGALRLEPRQLLLFLGVALFLAGVWLCGTAGRMRETAAAGPKPAGSSLAPYLFCAGAGVMSAIFNVGYSLAQPIAITGERLGHPRFLATNCIWLLMLGAGSIPNIVYCLRLLRRNGSHNLFVSSDAARGFLLSGSMGLLWGGSIFIYGAATPLLGDIGPSIGWPLSLATGLLVANLMGFLLGEWRGARPEAVRRLRFGILTLLAAIAVCAVSTKAGA